MLFDYFIADVDQDAVGDGHAVGAGRKLLSSSLLLFLKNRCQRDKWKKHLALTPAMVVVDNCFKDVCAKSTLTKL